MHIPVVPPSSVVVEFKSSLLATKVYQVVHLSAVRWQLRKQGMALKPTHHPYALVVKDSGHVVSGVTERDLTYYRAKAAQVPLQQPFLPFVARNPALTLN